MKKHQKKIRLARRMMTPKEISDGVSIFGSAQWNKRKEAKLVKMTMSILGKRSGAKKPLEHFKMMNQKSLETRRANKLKANATLTR